MKDLSRFKAVKALVQSVYEMSKFFLNAAVRKPSLYRNRLHFLSLKLFVTNLSRQKCKKNILQPVLLTFEEHHAPEKTHLWRCVSSAFKKHYLFRWAQCQFTTAVFRAPGKRRPFLVMCSKSGYANNIAAIQNSSGEGSVDFINFLWHQLRQFTEKFTGWSVRKL